MDTNVDKAGVKYWENVWQGQTVPDPIDPGKGRLRNFVYRRFHQVFREILGPGQHPGLELLEIGCGRSQWLPYFAREFGFQVNGIDYSPVGCEQAQAILTKAGISGRIVRGDLFTPPADLVGAFDVLVSFGVVEHFEDTRNCLTALARFLKPGGLMITSVPNVPGWIGSFQKVVDRSVYDVHVPLDPQGLLEAHLGAGLTMVSCRYLLGANWGVINTSGWRTNRLYPVIRMIPLMASLPFWLAETVGLLRPNRWTSPYILCSARKPGGSEIPLENSSGVGAAEHQVVLPKQQDAIGVT